MSPAQNQKAAKKQRLLKMSELSSLTRVPPGTIRYYISEGLLPRPHKTHRNMAYYDEGYVQRVKLIRELQEKRYFPLSIIKQILEQSESSMDSQEIKTILELEGKLFKNISSVPKLQPLSIQELSRQTGVSVDEITDMEKVGIIWRKSDGKFDEDSVRILEILKSLREAGYTEEAGFNSEFIKIYVDLIEVLARQEVRFFSKTVTGKMSSDEMVKMAESGIDLLNSFIGLLRKRMILRIGRELEQGLA